MTTEPSDIAKVIGEMERDTKGIRKQIIDICFHMKGGINYNEGWTLSFEDRKTIIEDLDKKLKKMSGDTREFM